MQYIIRNLVTKLEFSVVKEDVGVLKYDVTILKEDVRVLKEDVRELKYDVAILKEDVRVLKYDVAKLKEDVELLKSDLASFRVEVAKEFALVRMEMAEKFNAAMNHANKVGLVQFLAIMVSLVTILYFMMRKMPA